jgi:hypothetical protein
VRRFSVRGASGEITLTVLRRRGTRYEAMARSDPILADGERTVDTDLPIRAGDIVGVELSPGAGVGVRRDVAGAAIARWIGPLTIEPRAPDRTDASAGELMLRVDYEPGAAWRPAGLLEGPRAAAAPAGRTLGMQTVDLPGGRTRTAAVVRADGVAVDLFRGGRRTTRLPVRGADPRGRLVRLETLGRPLIIVRWRNPDGRSVRRDYAVLDDSLSPRR